MKEERLVEARCIGKNWPDEYKRKLVSAEEAVKVVKSGDRDWSTDDKRARWTA